MNKRYVRLLVICILALQVLAGCLESSDEKETGTNEYRTIVDMRGETVRVPKNITRVIDISDGFTASVMQSLGVADRVVGLATCDLNELLAFARSG